MNRLCFLTLLLVLWMGTTPAKSMADIVLTVGNGQGVAGAVAAQGNSVSFEVVALRTGDAFALGGYSLFFDIAREGEPYSFGLPNGLVEANVTVPTSSVLAGFNVAPVDYSLANSLTSDKPNFDFSINGTNSDPGGNSMNGPLSLFRLNIDTTNLASGTYSVIFRPEPALLDGINPGPIGFDPFTAGTNGGDFGIVTANSVAFTVNSTAVPEPTSLLLVGTLAACAASANRFRSQRRKLRT